MVTLSNNAPTNLMGGTTWYLNGDNNNLLYEKEVKANGVTENRHYLQAAGMTFAMALSRLEQFTPNANEIATAAASEKEAKEL